MHTPSESHMPASQPHACQPAMRQSSKTGTPAPRTKLYFSLITHRNRHHSLAGPQVQVSTGSCAAALSQESTACKSTDILIQQCRRLLALVWRWRLEQPVKPIVQPSTAQQRTASKHLVILSSAGSEQQETTVQAGDRASDAASIHQGCVRAAATAQHTTAIAVGHP
jgi:hypothetical protein